MHIFMVLAAFTTVAVLSTHSASGQKTADVALKATLNVKGTQHWRSYFYPGHGLLEAFSNR